MSGLSPRLIRVNISGNIENPGLIKIPLECSLSDAINLSGPQKTLSGKISLVRYQKDGAIIRKKINFEANAKPGSVSNPYLESGDLITVRKSIYGKTAGIIKSITEPFIGIYTTKKVFEEF